MIVYTNTSCSGLSWGVKFDKNYRDYTILHMVLIADEISLSERQIGLGSDIGCERNLLNYQQNFIIDNFMLHIFS